MSHLRRGCSAVPIRVVSKLLIFRSFGVVCGVWACLTVMSYIMTDMYDINREVVRPLCQT
jgi:hypothetical protein